MMFLAILAFPIRAIMSMSKEECSSEYTDIDLPFSRWWNFRFRLQCIRAPDRRERARNERRTPDAADAALPLPRASAFARRARKRTPTSRPRLPTPATRRARRRPAAAPPWTRQPSPWGRPARRWTTRRTSSPRRGRARSTLGTRGGAAPAAPRRRSASAWRTLGWPARAPACFWGPPRAGASPLSLAPCAGTLPPRPPVPRPWTPAGARHRIRRRSCSRCKTPTPLDSFLFYFIFIFSLKKKKGKRKQVEFGAQWTSLLFSHASSYWAWSARRRRCSRRSWQTMSGRSLIPRKTAPSRPSSSRTGTTLWSRGTVLRFLVFPCNFFLFQWHSFFCTYRRISFFFFFCKNSKYLLNISFSLFWFSFLLFSLSLSLSLHFLILTFLYFSFYLNF